jgi:hypothetical protein
MFLDGCTPAVRDAASSAIFGPSAPSSRRCGRNLVGGLVEAVKERPDRGDRVSVDPAGAHRRVLVAHSEPGDRPRPELWVQLVQPIPAGPWVLPPNPQHTDHDRRVRCGAQQVAYIVEDATTVQAWDADARNPNASSSPAASWTCRRSASLRALHAHPPQKRPHPIDHDDLRDFVPIGS